MKALSFRCYSRLFCLLLSCLFFASCSLSSAKVRETASPHRLTIIGTADLQGNVEPIQTYGGGKSEIQPVGGIARLATLIKKIEAEKPGTVAVVSCGDDLMGRYFHTFKGRALSRLLSLAGYEIFAFGNHEFDKGPEVLSEALREARFEPICSDLDVNGTPLYGLCQPWLIRDYQGLKVGFFSLMTEDFAFVTSSSGVRLIDNNLEIARRMVERLREQGAQLIVALTHVGYAKDRELAGTVPGIDVIFGGHSHEYLPKLTRVGNTLIVNGGEKGSFLVQLDLVADSNGTMDPEKAQYQLIPVTSDIPTHAQVEALLAEYEDLFPEAVVLGRTDVEWDLTKQALRYRESSVANLINDLMREKFSAEVVLNNAGAFRGKITYPPGPITDTMLKEIDEFSNYAYTLDIEGRHIVEMLERSAANFGKGGFLQVSGLCYTVDLKKPSQEIEADALGRWVVPRAGQRVKDVRVSDGKAGWVPIDPDRTYRVLSNGFLVNQQGDAYF